MRERAEQPSPAEVRAQAPAGARALAPYERLRALQRAAGNAAFGRWLARQEEDPTPLDTGPTRIDRHDIIIQTAFGPTLSPSGGYDWRVTYQLPFAAEADGFMIQELYMEASGGGGTHFWECWRVRRGERVPADRGSDGYDDRYVFGNVPGAPQAASGWKRHVGVIRFYPGPLPSQFGPDSAGQHFYHSTSRPDGWTGAGTRHDAYSEWSPGPPARNGFVGYAGTTEVRTGDRVTFRPR